MLLSRLGTFRPTIKSCRWDIYRTNSLCLQESRILDLYRALIFICFMGQINYLGLDTETHFVYRDVYYELSFIKFWGVHGIRYERDEAYQI